MPLSSLVLGLAAAVLLAACGAEPGGVTATQSAGIWATYRSAEYHFAIGYDPRLFKAAATLDQNNAPAGGIPELDWAAWPKSLGAEEPDNPDAVVTVTASNWRQFGEVTPARVTKVTVSALRDMASPHGRFDKAVVGGVPGYRARFVGNDGSWNVWEYCVRGQFDYQVQLSCKLSEWRSNRVSMTAILDAFRTF
jgi:hypothetical protein